MNKARNWKYVCGTLVSLIWFGCETPNFTEGLTSSQAAIEAPTEGLGADGENGYEGSGDSPTGDGSGGSPEEGCRANLDGSCDEPCDDDECGGGGRNRSNPAQRINNQQDRLAAGRPGGSGTATGGSGTTLAARIAAAIQQNAGQRTQATEWITPSLPSVG